MQPEGQDVLIGVFRAHAGEESGQANTGLHNKETDYLSIANRDAFQARTAMLHIRGKNAQVQRMDKTTAEWVDCRSETEGNTTRVRIELEDGGGELLKVTGHVR